MKYFIFIPVFLILAISCGSITTLDEYGKKVEVYDSYLDAPNLNKYYSKVIECNQSINMSSKANNANSCINFIRNSAGKMGASFVIVDRFQQRLPSGNSCNNCVSMTGDAYIKKTNK